MNKCFIKAMALEDPEFKFLYMSNRISISYFYVELNDYSIIKVFGYDETADYIYKNIKKGDILIILGELRNNNNNIEIEIKEIKRCKNAEI